MRHAIRGDEHLVQGCGDAHLVFSLGEHKDKRGAVYIYQVLPMGKASPLRGSVRLEGDHQVSLQPGIIQHQVFVNIREA